MITYSLYLLCWAATDHIFAIVRLGKLLFEWLQLLMIYKVLVYFVDIDHRVTSQNMSALQSTEAFIYSLL